MWSVQTRYLLPHMLLLLETKEQQATTLHITSHTTTSHTTHHTSHYTLSLLAPVAELLQGVQEHVGLGPELYPAVDLVHGTV